LGAALFERTGRGVLPTAAGRAIVESARQMESGAVELGRALATATCAEAGTVRITSSEIAAAWLSWIGAASREST